jgi:adenylate cyclase
MNQEEFKRKLTAILSADVEGYSRLMGEDEEATVRTLKAYRGLMTTIIGQHHGRLIDSPGDNLLAEFSSVVEALRCAWDIQQEIRTRNLDLPENRRMLFRIGVNLGDVIEEEGRIYGDGVNVAARLESIAEPGGISISGTAYDQVKNKLPWQYEYQGEQTVKNIAEPVRVYRVVMEPRAGVAQITEEKIPGLKKWKWAGFGAIAFLILGAITVGVWHFYFRPQPPSAEVTSVWAPALELPDKPSIAVLPFANISGDPEQEYFSDGITEEIITGLSKVPRLFVIARNSTFTYKGKPVMVQQVGQELGVRYVLEGSVRKAGDRVRITAQLVDAMTGKHLWAEKYDRDLKDILALQDEIMMKVIAALQVKLTEGEQALIVAGGTDNFQAYAKFLQGVEYVKRFNREGNLLARKMAEEAIDLDPNYPRGYRLLATTHWLDVSLGISKSPKQSLAKSAELYQRVIALDPTDAPAHGFLGMVYTLMRQHEKGIAEVEKAVALNPNAADAQCFFGYILHFNGRHKEAIEAIKKAIRLNPFPPNWYFQILGFAYCHAGMYEESISALKEALRVSPDNLFAHTRLTAAYSLSGREQEARAEAAEILRINPKFSLEYFAKTQPYKNPHDRALLIDALRKAGLK